MCQSVQRGWLAVWMGIPLITKMQSALSYWGAVKGQETLTLLALSGHSFPQATCDILELNAVVSSRKKFGWKQSQRKRKNRSCLLVDHSPELTLFVCFFYVPLAWLIFSSLVSATLVSLPWPVLVHPANNCSFCSQAGKEYQGREAEWYSRFPKDQSVFLSLELDMRAWLVLKGCTKTLQKWAVKSLPCPNGSVQCSICKRIKASWNLASHGLVTFSDVSVLILVC